VAELLRHVDERRAAVLVVGLERDDLPQEGLGDPAEAAGCEADAVERVLLGVGADELGEDLVEELVGERVGGGRCGEEGGSGVVRRRGGRGAGAAARGRHGVRG